MYTEHGRIVKIKNNTEKRQPDPDVADKTIVPRAVHIFW